MGESLDDWREFFRTTDTDVLEFIEKAITIATLDRPEDFLSRRGRIAERLFSSETIGARGDRTVASKESKANDVVSINDSHEEAEALSDDTEDASRVVGEVLRIKRALDDSRHESDSALHESLRRLESMTITVDILEKTKIGVSVNSLRRNCTSKQIAQLAHEITMRWKALVEDICRRTEDVADPGNIGGGTSSVKNRNIRTPGQEKYDFNKAGSLANTNQRTNVNQLKFEKERILRSQDSNGSVTGCKRRLADRPDEIKGWNEVVTDVKFQATKRKMQGLYQKAETDKRQRTVQVLDPGHLPKTAASPKPPCAKTAKARRWRLSSRSRVSCV